MWQKKRVWQVTTIIQLALCHLVTSHFQEIACNYTPKGQIRWPIFLLLLCMIVLTEITSKFPKPIIFRILVFSCHKMTLITIITRMPLLCDVLLIECQNVIYELEKGRGGAWSNFRSSENVIFLRTFLPSKFQRPGKLIRKNNGGLNNFEKGHNDI